MESAFRRPERVARLLVVDIAPVPYLEVESIRGLIRLMLDLPLERIQSLKDANDALAPFVHVRTIVA